MEDEEEALAKALERSRIDHQQSQAASANPPDQKGHPSFSTRPPQIHLVNSLTSVFGTECKLKIVR